MYFFVADDSGNPGINDKTSNTYSFGGYVIEQSQGEKLSSIWKKVKNAIAEQGIKEIKWKHFFLENDPLKLKVNQIARRQIAAFILKGLFDTVELLPLVSVVRKDKADGDLVIKTKSGGNMLREDFFWLSTLALFGNFLDKKKSRGQIIFDSLNHLQETERQSTWSELRVAKENNLPEKILVNLRKLLLIEDEIKFMNSANSDLVQVADFFCGIVRRAADGDEELLAAFQKDFGERAEREGLGLLHLV